MDTSEPRMRHRGCFSSPAETSDPDLGEDAAAEGISIRIRLVRSRHKPLVIGGGRQVAERSPAAGGSRVTLRVTHPSAATGTRYLAVPIRSTTATGSRPPQR